MKQIFCLLLSLFAVTYAQQGRGIKIRSDSARIAFGKKLDVTLARKPDGALLVKAKYVEVKALKVNGKNLADYIVTTAKKRLNQICPKCGADGTGGKKTTPKKGKTTPKKKPTKKPTKKLVMAAKGKANCAGKGTPVKDIKGCQAAAKALKRPFGGASGGYAAYPKGCFVVNNKFYYNTGKTGKGNNNAQPVCETTTAATKKPTKKLVLAAKGKANCAGKGTPVKDEKACKAAAKASKKQFQASNSYPSFPKGCFVSKNKFYYNKGKTGKGNNNAQPVCVATTAATKKPTNKFIMAAKGKANCAGKGTPVKDEKACKAAAKAIKKNFGGSSASYTKYPKGCFMTANNLYFNKGKTGAGNSKAQAVCVTTASATKKPTKKLVLAAKGKANCAGKGTAVQGFNGCKAAAKAIKKSFIPKPSKSSVLPKGCVVYNNKVQYNTLNGKANKNAQPVCVQVASATKKPTKKLVLAAKGKANCAGTGTPVAAKGCQAAAKALKKAYKGVSRLSFLPKGCLVYNNRVQYNTLNGKANKNAQPVCVQVKK